MSILQVEGYSVPTTGFLGPIKVAEDIWIVRTLFFLGAGQEEGLTWAGLKGRLLSLLGEKPIAHPALNFGTNESTKEEIVEEISKVQELVAGHKVPFPLDCTMTIVRKGTNLTLHSVVPLTESLLEEVTKLGKVTVLLAPNLQHWLFLPSWLAAFPEVGLENIG